MKKKRKAYIDTYSSIYPVDLVVANGAVTIEDLRKDYCEIDGTEIEDYDTKQFGGVTLTGIRKSDDHYVIIVWLQSLEDIYFSKGVSKLNKQIEYISILAHEAAHAALFTYRKIQESICTVDQEPFAYYMQWIVKCICKTMFKK